MRYLDSDHANGGVKYYKRISIGNANNIEAFVVSGSSDCLIKASLVLDNDYKYIRAPSTLVGFGKTNNEVKSSCVIEEKVRVDACTVEKVRFRVVADDVLPCDAIIGRNFTEDANVTYFRIDDRLEFRTRNEFEFSENPIIDSGNDNRVELKIDNQTDVPRSTDSYKRR